MQIRIFSFYKFQPLTSERVAELETLLNEQATTFSARGLMIMGTEGVNATLCAPADQAMEYFAALSSLLDMGPLDVKWSEADRYPFHDFKIRVREEIVTLARTDIVPRERHNHLSAEEWDKMLADENSVVIDTRNSYEYEIGKFKGAIDPKTREFNEFPEWLKNSGIPKDKNVMIYCTGGIRCEKAIYAAEEAGYKNVYQLDGGILRYLEKKPNQSFEGECFVFDYRVAVDQNLKPTTTYKLCPHCGQPAKTKIECSHCHAEALVCDPCLANGSDKKTCSKNCAHHYRMGHKFKKPHLDAVKAHEPT